MPMRYWIAFLEEYYGWYCALAPTIKDLGDELKCVIVVSHQQEFFDEFPNKYFVELVNGSTHVSFN